MAENNPNDLNNAGSGNNMQMQDMQKRAQDMLNQLGIDIPTAITALVLALVTGLVAAIIDRVLGLPDISFKGGDSLEVDLTGNLLFFGAFIAVLNGATYAFLKEKVDLGGVVMAAVSGFVAFLVWWIVTKIIGGQEFTLESEAKVNVDYNAADAFNVLELLVDGVVLGLIGFGWFALLKRLPDIGGMLNRG